MAKDDYIKGSSNGPSRTDKILIETLEDFASYSKIPFSEPIEILKQNQGLKMSKELGYTEDGFLYLYNSIDDTYQYVDSKDIKKLKLFLQENDLIEFLYTNQLYVPFQIDADKEILTKEKISKLPDIPVNHITEGEGIIRNLKEKYLNELIDLDVDFDNFDGGRINIQSLFIDSDTKEKEIYENVINKLNELSNKYNIPINNYDDNPIHNFYNIINTPTNVVDDVVIGIDRSGYEATVSVNENGYVELYRSTDNPERFVISDFMNQGDLQSLGLGTQSYFATNAPYAHKYTGTNKRLYKFSTNIRPDEILDLSPVSLKNKHPELYTLIFGENEIRNTKAIQDNIETIKELGYKAIGNRETGSTGLLQVAQYEIIPLTTANETYNIKPIATLKTKEGFDAGKSPEAFIETPLDTPTNVVGNEFVDEIVNANTQLVNDLPLSETVKNQFDNVVRGRAKNLATPGGVVDAVDVWELGVLGLMITAIAYKEFDEIPTIFKRTAGNMFNSMTSMYNIPPVPLEQYDLDYEFIEKVITTGEKVMPTDIIIKKVGEIAKGVGEQGLATGFGYVPTTPKNTDTMETTQKIQPGVQEEKMFKQLKPKKIKSTSGSGARIQ